MKTTHRRQNVTAYVAALAATIAPYATASAQQTQWLGQYNWDSNMQIFIKIIAVILVLMTINMLYILIRGGRYKSEYTTGYMKTKRERKIEKEKEKSKQPDNNTTESTGDEKQTYTSETSDEEEIKSCREKLDKACEKLDIEKLVRPESIYYSNLSISRIRYANKRLREVIEYAPTDNNIVEQLNQCSAVINTAEKRRFFGSKALMGVTVVIAVIAYLSGLYGVTILLACGLTTYFFASFTPYFLYEKRKQKGENDIFNGLLGNTFAAVIGTKRFKRIFSSTKTQDENSGNTSIAQKILYAIIFIILCIVFSLLTPLWAVFNYIRNYIFYF